MSHPSRSGGESEAGRADRVDRILYRVLERPPEERATALAAACGGDAGLRREVESLLAAAETMEEGFLEEPLLPLGTDPLPELGEDRRLGPWRIGRELARGGMGKVYLAVRDDGTYEQRVAVKVLKRGLDSEEIVRRFHQERQILARLDHPGIARLLDGGATADGLPYLVMEHVEGEPIDRWCDRQRLGVRARLELFVKVCAVVQFAHQHLVVHRDLKPGNILVTPQGEPKLLDFGIAKLLDPDGERPTMPGLRPLTPEHASPEQIRGEAVTTASDVYALGGLLYELLTGRHPHGPTGGAPEALFHRVLHEEPEPPSRALLNRGKAAGAAAARARGTDPRSLRRRLTGDLDAIVLRTLEKEPRRRYASVEQLAEDLQRHLAGRPVLARRASLPYRAGKLVRRHRVGVGLAAAVALALLAFGVGLKLERDRAVLERQRAEVVTEFMVGAFRQPHPEVSQGEEVTARQLLDKEAQRLRGDEDLARQPGMWAALADAMGWAYLGLGHHEEAEALLVEALRLRRSSSATRPEDLAASLLHVAAVHRARERYGEARALAREAVELLRSGGADSPALARVLNNQAALLEDQGDLDGAEELYREALRMKIRLLGEEHPDVATGKNNLALVLKQQGHYGEAEELYRQSLELRRRLRGEGSTEVATSLNNLALLLQDRDDLAAAEPLLREAVELRRRLYGPDHPAFANGLNNLAFLLQLRGNYGEADPLYRQAQEILVADLGPEHSRVGGVLRNRAALALEVGELAEAEGLAARAVEVLRISLGAGHWRVADTESVLGAALAAQGRFAEAEPLLAAAPAVLAEALGEGARQTREAGGRLAGFEAARPASGSRRH